MKILRWLVLVAAFLTPWIAAAQVTVTGTVTDANSQAFANGSYSFALVPNPQYPTGPYTFGGNPVTTPVAGALNGSGAFSVSIAPNSQITPPQSVWAVTVCPAADAPCSTFNVSISGAGDISGQLTPAAISVPAKSGSQTKAYTDAEISGAVPGFVYWNLTSNTLRGCQGPLPCTWVAVGGGSGSLNPTGSPANNNLACWSGATTLTNCNLSGDATTSNTSAVTLAASGVTAGSCGDTTHSCGITVDAKGRVTVQTNNTIAAGSGNVSNSGTPTNGQMAQWTNATTIQGINTTGSGNAVLATSPTLVTPALGTPSTLVLTNATLLPCGALPALTGDATTSAGSCATTVGAINGTAFPASATVVGSNSSSQPIAASLANTKIWIGSAGGLPVAFAISGDSTMSAGGVMTNVGVNGATVPTSAKILGTNGSAQEIAAALTSAHLYVGNGSNLPVDVAVSGDVSLTNAGAFTVTQIEGGAIPVSAKIVGTNSSSQPIAAALTSAHLYVGNGSNLPVDVAASGDVSLTNAGAFTVTQIEGAAIPTSANFVGTNSSKQLVAAQPFTTNAQTATYQVLASDFAICKTIPVASGTFTITLVASGSQPANGTCIFIINYGSGVVTVAASGQNINGVSTSQSLAAGSASAPTGLFVVSDGTNYEAQPFVASSGGGSTPLSSITAATTSHTIANGNNPQVWGFAQTTNSQTAFIFNDTTAATGTSDVLLGVTTSATSTEIPLQITEGSGPSGAAAPAALSISAGTGGAPSPTTTGAGNTGAAIALTCGAGSAGGSTSGNGGVGGACSLVGGVGGTITGASNTGGAGGTASTTGGVGGAGVGTGSTGGAGGAATFAGGQGGNNSSAGINGAGGALTLNGGQPGTGGSGTQVGLVGIQNGSGAGNVDIATGGGLVGVGVAHQAGVQLQVNGVATGTVVTVFNGLSGATGDLTDWNVNGATLAAMNKSGNLAVTAQLTTVGNSALTILNAGTNKNTTIQATGTGNIVLGGGQTAAANPVAQVKQPASATGDYLDLIESGGTIDYSVGPNGIPQIGANQTATVTGADYTNSTVTPSTVFSYTLPATIAAKNYKYTCDIMWESTAATLVGPVFGLNLSAAPTQLTGAAWVNYSSAAGAQLATTGYLSNTTTGSQTLITATAAGATTTNYIAKIWGTIEGAATAGSTFIINAASTSGTTATLNIRRGSSCTLTAY